MRERELFRLDGRVAVVTGGASGIGRSITLHLARQGARVTILDRDAAGAADVAAAARSDGADVEAVTCDVTRAEEVEAAFARIEQAHGGLNILVNSAGIGQVATIATTSEADMDRLYAVNVKGTFLCTKAALPLLIASGGGVVLNLGSTAALIGTAERFAYSPSRFTALFRERTGFPPVEYSLRQRIRAACRLLDAEAFEVKEVAARVGFEDPLYLSRQFKRVMGIPPGEYRNRPKG